MVLADFVGYWLHRLQHGWPVLWRLHAVHHSSTKVDWLAGGRNHPLEGVIARTLTIAPLFLRGSCRWCGTAYEPAEAGARARVFGLVGERMPVGLWAQLRYPFR